MAGLRQPLQGNKEWHRWHRMALIDIGTSALLIRGFGVRVPSGAPVFNLLLSTVDRGGIYGFRTVILTPRLHRLGTTRLTDRRFQRVSRRGVGGSADGGSPWRCAARRVGERWSGRVGVA